MIDLLAATADAAVQRRLGWDWDWSPWATGLAIVAAVAWVAAIYAHEPKFVGTSKRTLLALLRLGAVASLVLMLAQPVIESARVAPPRLALVIDQSASMNTRDVSAGDLQSGSGTAKMSRKEAWKSLLGENGGASLDKLRSRFALDAVSVAAAAESVTLNGAQSTEVWLTSLEAAAAKQDAGGTRLGDAIDRTARRLDGPRPAAAIVLSDGIVTAGLSLADAAARARTAGVPVYAIAIGSDRPQRDVAIDDVVAEEVVFPGDRLQVEANIRATGYANAEALVTLKDQDSQQVLAETPLALPADGELGVARLALRPTKPGPLRIEVEVAIQPQEDNPENNRAELSIDVRQEPIRVLLADSTPSFEYRALKSLLERDPAIELRAFLQDADADYPSIDAAALPAFPASKAELLQYDVILLLDVDPQAIAASVWGNVSELVSKEGGGLVLVAGPRFMPRAYAGIEAMRPLLPIELAAANSLRAGGAATADFKILPTKLGLQQSSMQLGDSIAQSEAIWNQLPPVTWLLEPLQLKPGAQVLAETVRATDADRKLPAIIHQYVGVGEVLMHATDETWRWRWRNDDRYFARYWGQAVRRLARGRALRGRGSLTTNRREYATSEAVTLQARLRQAEQAASDAVSVELEGASSPTRSIRLIRRAGYAALYETVLRNLAPDSYTARIASSAPSGVLSTQFTVKAPPGELARLVVNLKGLEELASATGGKAYTLKSAGRLLDELPAASPTAIEQLPDEPLWNRPWPLAALCVLLGSEWLLRRRSGML